MSILGNKQEKWLMSAMSRFVHRYHKNEDAFTFSNTFLKTFNESVSLVILMMKLSYSN